MRDLPPLISPFWRLTYARYVFITGGDPERDDVVFVGRFHRAGENMWFACKFKSPRILRRNENRMTRKRRRGRSWRWEPGRLDRPSDDDDAPDLFVFCAKRARLHNGQCAPPTTVPSRGLWPLCWSCSNRFFGSDRPAALRDKGLVMKLCFAWKVHKILIKIN